MKQKKNEMVDRAEIIDDPSKRYEELQKISTELNSILDIQNNLSTSFSRIESELRTLISHDPEIKTSATVQTIINYFERIIKEFSVLDTLSSTIREQLYNVIYNISLLIYEFAHKMRKNSFSIHSAKYLIWIISHIESNIVLSGVKYLKWRIKLYVELAFIYSDYKGYSSAFKTITQAVNKLNDLKAIEEQQGPLPEYIKTMFIDAFRYLKFFEFKYGVASGTFTFDVWKKKLDETFTTDEEKLNRNICMINSVSELSWYHSVVGHDAKKVPWKPQAVQFCYDALKDDIEAIKKGILDFIEGKKNEFEMKKQMELNPKKESEEEKEEVKEEVPPPDPKDKKKPDPKNKGNANAQNKKQQVEEVEEKKVYPVTKTFITQSRNVPIEIHVELLKMCYDCEMWKEFIELIDSINVRIKYRNVELPYIADVDIQMASVPNIPAKKYYEKIELDLNINNFKREVKRLREEGKYVEPGSQRENSATPQNPKDQKKVADKNKKNPKKDTLPPITQPDNEQENKYEPIEGLEHNFVYLLVKRSHDPKKALTSIRVKMSNELKIKNELQQNERAIALPIKTFKDNLYEANEAPKPNENKNDFTANLLNKQTKMVPYLIVKKNISALEGDNEKLSALVDILPLISNSPYQSPPMYFTKIDPEISIPGKVADPNYIQYNYSHNYVNFCYRTDKEFYIIERESEILRNLYELEISKNKSNEDDAEKFLHIDYSIDKIDILATWMYNAIQGQIGEYFLDKRSNFLYDICILLWNKYLKDFLYRIDFYYNTHDELETSLCNKIQEKLAGIINSVFNTLYCVHYVLTKIKEKDVIIYAFITNRLADFAERTGNNATGVLILQNTIEYIEAVKENENIFSFNHTENKHTFTCFTTDNNKIKSLLDDIEQVYDDYVRKLNLKRRVNYKISMNEPKSKLNNDLIAEEDFEWNYCEEEFTKSLKEQNVTTYDGKSAFTQQDSNKSKISINYYVTEYENDLNCIYIELICKMYRLYIKSGDDIIDKYDWTNASLPKKYSRNNSNETISMLSSSGKRVKISQKNLKKLDIIKGDTAKAVKANMEYLKHSLQDAGKLEPDKPILSKSEKMLQFSIGKNPYLNALYQATLALTRPNNKQDQIFLLRLASSLIEKCFTEEKERYDYYLKNFFYIKSLERYDINSNKNFYHYYPYSLLNKPIMIDNVDKIPEPILVSKSSHTCTFIFPRIKIRNDQLDKVHHNIPKIALYGQPSTGTNIVQLNNKSLEHTGEIVSILNHITVGGLRKNDKYIFAYAGYDDSDVIVNTIGQTSKEVEMYFPLPLFYISYQVCKIAYEFRHYAIVKDKSKVVFAAYTEKSDIKDTDLDSKGNCVSFYKLKYDAIKRTSVYELEGVAYCFFYFAKSVSMLKKEDHKVDNGVNITSKQKNILKNINILSLGLEIAISIRHYQLIRMFIVELYNSTVPFINSKETYKQLLSVYMKMSLGASMIPNELYNSNMRRIASLVSYNVFILANRINEKDLITKGLTMNLAKARKRYYPFVYTYMEKIEEDPKAKKKNEKDPKGKPQKDNKETKDNKTNAIEEDEGENVKYEEKKATILKDLERECIEIDELIFSCGDFNDTMRASLGTYINSLDKYLTKYKIEEYPALNIEIENRKKDITEIIEVYDGIKTEGIKYLAKYITSNKDTPRYYEFIGKMLSKLLSSYSASFAGLNTSSKAITSSGTDNKKGGATTNKDSIFTQFSELAKLIEDISLNDESMKFIYDIYSQKKRFLNGDILYSMKVRIHDYITQIKREMPNDQISVDIDLDKMRSEIEEKFFGCVVDEEILPPYLSMEDGECAGVKVKLYWFGEIAFNKAISLYLDYSNNVTNNNHFSLLNFDFNNFFEYKLCDLKKVKKFLEKKNENKFEDDLQLLDIRSGLFVKKIEKKEEKIEENEKIDENDKKNDKNAKNQKKGKNDKYSDLVIEKIDPFDDHIEQKFDIRYSKLEKIFEKIAFAAVCSKENENYFAFDSQIAFAYNILIYDMLTPYDASENEIWLYISIIAEIALNRLTHIKNGYGSYTPNSLIREISKISAKIKTNKDYPLSIQTIPKNTNEQREKIDEEQLTSQFSSKTNFDIYIEFIAFAMQCLYVKQKWNILSNLITNFNSITNDLFNEFTLAFLIEAQTHIYEKANANTQAKQTEINHRVELYENWKNSRKKNKRQQLITGEIPQEQIDFDRDYSILSKQLFIFSSISDMLRNDKEKSENLYNAFLNDANNALKAVTQCRKKYEEYQIEVISMKKYAYNYTKNYKEFQAKTKAISHLTSNMIGTYKSCIQVLKKRQENYLLIQILYEMSRVMFASGDSKSAEVYFNEALDTVFQKLYSIKEFRKIFTIGSNAAEKYGIRALVLAICILHKMNKFCYDNDLYNQRECAQMAGEISYSILNNIIPHPMIYTKYGTYRISEINRNVDIFKSNEGIKQNDLAISLIELSETLIAYGDYELCLPMLSFAEYISCDICKSVYYTLKTRIMRIEALSELGYINEAIMIFNKIMKKIDLPSIIGYGYNEYTVGRYASVSDIKYYNDLPPEDPKNIEAMNAFMKLVVDGDLKGMIGANAYYELMYMKLMILYRVYYKENYMVYPEKNTFSDVRTEMFMRIDKEARENIIALSQCEDLCALDNLLKEIKVNGYEDKYNEVVKGKIDSVLAVARMTSEEMNNFVLGKFNRSNYDLSKERYELIIRYRLLLSKVFSCQGMLMNSSGVLLKSMEFFSKLATTKTKLLGFDNGEDYVFDFKPSEVKDSKGKAPQKKDVKPPPQKDKGKQDKKEQNDKPPINPEEELNKLLVLTTQNMRIIPNAVYWFKLHYNHLQNCYKMGRYDDCLKIANKIEKNSSRVNDVYYYTRGKEIEVMTHIQNYDVENAKKAYSAILSKGKVFFINDYEICYFYANYAEYLYIEGNIDLAISHLKIARTIIWEKMAKNNYLITKPSIYGEKILRGLLIDKSLTSILKDKESNFASSTTKKTEPKKGAPAGTETEEIDYFTNPPEESEDNFTEPKQEYVKGENVYDRYCELICKIELKYLLFQFISKEIPQINMKTILSVLNDLEIMVKKLLYPHSIYSIVINYIRGLICKIDFIADLNDFLQSKFYGNLKMLKKNNIDTLTLDKQTLFTFSNYYNEKCIKKWRPLLLQSKDYFEAALTLSKTNNESLFFENGFSLEMITSQLADISFFLSEYTMINNFKYCDFKQVVNKIRSLIEKEIFYDNEKDDLPQGEEIPEPLLTEAEEFMNQKKKKELCELSNDLQSYLYYSELTSKLNLIRKTLFDLSTEIASSNLIDASKLPREMINSLLESDYLLKKKNAKYVPTAPTPKASVDAYDVIFGYRSLLKQSEYFTFSFPHLDSQIKLISKLHRYLKNNSSNYSSKCWLDVQKYTKDDKLDKFDFVKPDSISINYITAQNQMINHLSPLFSGMVEGTEQKVNVVYLLGVNSGEEAKEDNTHLYGRVLLPANFVKEMNKKIYNLKIKLRQSMTFSEEKKKRDFKYYQIEFYDFVFMFILSMLKGKKAFAEMKNVKEVFTEEDIGEVSIEALEYWYLFFNFGTFITTNKKYNALMRKIHLCLLK